MLLLVSIHYIEIVFRSIRNSYDTMTSLSIALFSGGTCSS